MGQPNIDPLNTFVKSNPVGDITFKTMDLAKSLLPGTSQASKGSAGGPPIIPGAMPTYLDNSAELARRNAYYNQGKPNVNFALNAQKTPANQFSSPVLGGGGLGSILASKLGK